MLRMSGNPWMGWRHPFAEMERLARQMDWLTSGSISRPGLPWFPAKVFPAVNITEDKDNYYVRAELPGIKADEITLEVTGRNLAISGERSIPSEGDNARYHRRERDAGKFSRLIVLPSNVDADSVDAKMVHGMLTITIAKSEAVKPKQITIH